MEVGKSSDSQSKVFVFADIEPIFTEDDSIDELYQIADLFLSLGANYFCWKPHKMTLYFVWPDILRQKHPDAFVITSFAVDQDGYTRKGIPLKKLAAQVKVGYRCVWFKLYVRTLSFAANCFRADSFQNH